MISLLLVFVFVIACFASIAQTATQENLLKEFFSVRGIKILNQWGLPGMEENLKSYSITINNNNITVEIKYYSNLNENIALYKIGIDNKGNFTQLNYQLKNITKNAFDVCDAFKTELLKKTEEDDRSDKVDILHNITLATGKALSDFSCNDYCLYALYYYWVKDGYYRVY